MTFLRKGFKIYWQTIQPLIQDLEVYKETLDNNPSCVMYQDVSMKYIEILHKAVSELEAIKNEVMANRNELKVYTKGFNLRNLQ